jgi:voltage-gated potassium channel
MKFLASQIAYLLTHREMRTNLRALAKYIAFLLFVVVVNTVVFHLIKVHVESENHSWITGLYWTLVVMTTLGFGDITFTSDIGRLFSVFVLLSGVVLLLVMLPFLFIRLFYAPWLEARVRLRAPREVPRSTSGHVIITEYDAIAVALIERLQAEGVPYFVVEPDPAEAARLVGDQVSVVLGDNDSRSTYERLAAPAARLVLANCDDTVNTNITLTVREIAPQVRIVSLIEEEDSADILELSGASLVLPLKHQLGEHLATRVDTGRAEAHVVGAFRELRIAELPARDTPFVDMNVRDTHLRARTGVSVVGLWQRGKLRPSFPHTRIPADGVLVLAGTASQIAMLNELSSRPERQAPPVLVIGAGKVGQAAARSLKSKGLSVHVIDRQAHALAPLEGDVDGTFAGDAADRRLLERAGIDRTPSVLLTTNDDAMNIYLAVYCRRLNPDVRLVSRITHERNVEAIHRAGADFALSYTSLGVEAVMSLLEGHDPMLLGEGVRLFSIQVPASLAGRPLRDSGIGSRTGLSVLALEHDDQLTAPLTTETLLPETAALVMLGSLEQRRKFTEAFE